jgi:hypothetical protein
VFYNQGSPATESKTVGAQPPRKKAKKDPAEPKKPMTAFLAFLNEERKNIKVLFVVIVVTIACFVTRLYPCEGCISGPGGERHGGQRR